MTIPDPRAPRLASEGAFRAALLMGALAITLALGGATAYLIWEGYQQSTAASEQQSVALAEGAMAALDKRLQVAAIKLYALADDPALTQLAAATPLPPDLLPRFTFRLRGIEDRDAYGPARLTLLDGSEHPLGFSDGQASAPDGGAWQRRDELRLLTRQPTPDGRVGTTPAALPRPSALGFWQRANQASASGVAADDWTLPLAVGLQDERFSLRGALSVAVRLRDVRAAWLALSPPVGSTLWLEDLRQPGRLLSVTATGLGVPDWLSGTTMPPEAQVIASGPRLREWPIEVKVTVPRDVALAPWKRYALSAVLACVLGAATIWLAVAVMLHGLRRLHHKEGERREAVQRLAVLAAVVESAPETVIVTNQLGLVVQVNPTGRRMFGAALAAPSTQRLDQRPVAADASFFPPGWPQQADAHTLSGETLGQGPDGETIALWRDLNPVYDETGSVTHWVFTLRDLREIRHAQAATQHLTWNDPLTGLANRNLLMRELAQAVQGHGALVLLNLAGFQAVNDAHGFGFGDEVLKRCADQLSAHQPPTGELARLGADEFALIWRQARPVSSAEASALVVAWLKRCASTVSVGEEPIPLRWRCGAALFEGAAAADGLGAAKLASDWLRRADLALQQARRASADVMVFTHEMGDAAARRLSMERRLASTQLDEELRLYLQPQVNEQGELKGFEALVRWEHPDHGLLAPAQFIALAESAGLIHRVDTWVLREACRLAAHQERQGLPVAVSVNVSAASFKRPEFLDIVRCALGDAGLSPGLLVLEITETLVLDEFDAVVAKMHELVGMGVELSLDDFGTGYSSLSYLKRLPIQELKIDRSFIMDIDTNDQSAALVYTIIALAQHLKLRVVAEGVETSSQALALVSAGSVVLQGYLYSPPAPAGELIGRTRFAPRAF